MENPLGSACSQELRCSPYLIWPLVRRDKYDVVLFYIHGKHLRSCRDGQLT